jgi:hypothetical protein
MSVQVTIDSSESLSDVLRVLGAVYDVTLTVSEEGTVGSTPPAESSPTPVPEKVRTRRARKKPAAEPAARAGNEQIRSWALENGLTVSNRGRLPGRVVAAYRDAHPSL